MLVSKHITCVFSINISLLLTKPPCGEERNEHWLPVGLGYHESPEVGICCTCFVFAATGIALGWSYWRSSNLAAYGRRGGSMYWHTTASFGLPGCLPHSCIMRIFLGRKSRQLWIVTLNVTIRCVSQASFANINYTPWVKRKKVGHSTSAHTFVKCWPIFKSFTRGLRSKFCNKVGILVKDPTTPQTRPYITLWNLSFQQETQLLLTICATDLCKCNDVADLTSISKIRLKNWFLTSGLSRSLKVIGTDTNRPEIYDFLLVFSSNFVPKTQFSRYSTSKMLWPWNPG